MLKLNIIKKKAYTVDRQRDSEHVLNIRMTQEILKKDKRKSTCRRVNIDDKAQVVYEIASSKNKREQEDNGIWNFLN